MSDRQPRKLPPPGTDLRSVLGLWPTAPEGTGTVFHRILEARMDVLLDLMMEIRDRDRGHDQSRNFQEVVTEAKTTSLQMQLPQNFALRDEQREAVILRLERATTLDMALNQAVILASEIHPIVPKRKSNASTRAGMEMKKFLLIHRRNLRPAEEQKFKDIEDTTWGSKFIEYQKRMLDEIPCSDENVHVDRMEKQEVGDGDGDENGNGFVVVRNPTVSDHSDQSPVSRKRKNKDVDVVRGSTSSRPSKQANMGTRGGCADAYISDSSA
ncbi:hypothetical protein BELL_0183g00230 [Botrytis elliptica]|uniref:Uncharacterized protein n=1 Tax=Botrytis elliptica TaxID=278938 RepID=A0A4Z1K3J2_9HELO|nr:hypothetical protein EAE99_010850 [Botrytis elliptica]TGO75963.1 hypothetical protein BELL_0183g00230 [Botrytis elliptica]